MKRFSIIAIIMILACCGCGKDNPTNGTGSKDFSPILLSKAETEITSDINDFGLNLFSASYSPESQMISPLSVSLAMSMAAYGAGGETYKQISEALGFENESPDDICSYYEKIVSALRNADSKTKFEIANSVWVSDGIDVFDSYKNGISKYFYSDAYSIDFSDPDSIKKIESWVSGKTGCPYSYQDAFDASSWMILINSLVFKSLWSAEQSRFLVDGQMSFTDIDGKAAKTKAITNPYISGYVCKDGFEKVTSYYGNSAFVMDLILPPSDIPFESSVTRLQSVYKDLIDEDNEPLQVRLTMPAFQFDSHVNIIGALYDMGMKLPFEEGGDFSKLCGNVMMHITSFEHQTKISVDENGTEASALSVTRVGVGAPMVRELVLDRPFIFVIRERSTDTILFIGQKVR